MDIRFLKGKSVSLTIVFNAEYNYANIQDIVVKINKEIISKKSDSTLLATANPRVFRVQLTSEYTNALGSLSKLQVYLDDSSIGVLPFEDINVYADESLGFANTSINEGSDYTINLTVSLLNPDLDIETVAIYNTFSSEALNLKANIASPTFTGKITTPDILVSNLTASQIVATDANDNLVSLATATYPSLSELRYVKGVTSALQTQLGAKANLASPTFTGTVNMATLAMSADATINGLTVGRGGGAITGNTAVGIRSLQVNTTGNNNTSIGFESLKSNTTGGNNNAIGLQSLFSNTTGVSNNAIGWQSLRENISGNNNIAIGVYSLNSNTAGSNNNVIGSTALFSNTTGGNNIAIGHQAGRYIADGTTANTITNNSLFLGYNTKALADNQTNQTVIGYDAIGLGSNTTVLGNSSTSFGRWWGNLLLGSSTNSGEALQVTGTTKLAGNTAVTGSLTVNSTTAGFLPPRMTTTQRTAISSPAEGLMVFDTTTKKSYTFDGTTWQAHF